MKDRNDYRSMSDEALVEEVHYGVHVDWKELAIVLSERLDNSLTSYGYDDDY